MTGARYRLRTGGIKRTPLVAPFPYFGSKRAVAPLVWQLLGSQIGRYIEPFFGSGAVLLQRPGIPYGATEIVNDLDGYVCNFWRAVQADPAAVARHMRWLCTELDLQARNEHLIRERPNVTARLLHHPEWYDAQIAGWWAWGASLWVGHGWAQTKQRQRGQVARQNAIQLAHDETDGQALERRMHELARRLQRVRVWSGDWSRCVTEAALFGQANADNRERIACAVFLDPPYLTSLRDPTCYQTDREGVAKEVREWAVTHAEDPRLRIALCGYAGEHELPGWTECEWVTNGGYATEGSRGQSNRARERIWFSPHCLPPRRVEGSA